MKQRFKLLLFIVLFMGVNKIYAQTEQTSDSTIVSGHFEINTISGADTNHVNVNYAVSPAPFTNNMNLELSTPDAILFNVDILDTANSVLLTWTPVSSSNYYNHSIDISSLTAGNYHLNIRRDNTGIILNTIYFTK
jgi:hypothetical protein